MGKTCEICNRTIKTGNKYCWEHRKNSYSSCNKIYDEVVSAFLGQSSFDIEKDRDKFIEEHKTLIKQFDEKSPEFLKFVKFYIKKIKEERKFIKLLLK